MGALFRNSLLFWTGMQRDAGDILQEQRTTSRTPATLDCGCVTWQRVPRLLLSHPTTCSGWGPARFGWRAKRGLASKITSMEIDRCYEFAAAR
jgi:galactokinase/mevalonate kinase-like predicted kinase